MTKTILFLIIAASFPFATHAESAKICHHLPVLGLSKAEFVKHIKDPACDVRTIEDVLAQLPQEFVEHSALAYRSRSLQGPLKDNFRFPRAIVFGPPENELPIDDNQQSPHWMSQLLNMPLDRRLIFAFNGHPSQPNYNSLEVAEVNPSGESVFNYFSIDFPPDRMDTWEQAQSQIYISANNPSTCIKCHGLPARPVMAAYPAWAGFYGSERFENARLEFPDDGHFDVERKHLDDLIAAKDKRYKHLFVGSNEQGTYNELHFPAQDLNQLLSRLNGERVAKIIMASPEYDKIKYALAGGLITCANWMSFLPNQVRARLAANLEPKIRLSLAQAMDEAQRYYDNPDDLRELFFFVSKGRILLGKNEYLNELRAQSGNDDFFLRLQMDTLALQGPHRDQFATASLRVLMEGRGMDISNWFMDLAQPTYRMSDGFILDREILLGLIRHDAVCVRWPIEFRSRADILTKHQAYSKASSSTHRSVAN